MPIVSILRSMLDPRGRCNRKGLLIAAVVMLVVEAVAGLGLWAAERALNDPILLPFKAAMIYLAVSAAAQRLHDLGLSAWRIGWATLAIFGWCIAVTLAAMVTFGPERMAPGEAGFTIVFASLLMPMLVMLLWLHFAPGEPGSNRFGPEPEALGFARHVGRGREVPGGAAGAAA